MQSLIDKSSFAKLGVEEIDKTHLHFVNLVNALGTSSSESFYQVFNQLYEHTEKHFAREKELMQKSHFPALTEHDAEHQRILGELAQIKRKIRQGASSFARAYVTDRLPEWFIQHLATMDSALAFHLKQKDY